MYIRQDGTTPARLCSAAAVVNAIYPRPCEGPRIEGVDWGAIAQLGEERGTIYSPQTVTTGEVYFTTVYAIVTPIDGGYRLIEALPTGRATDFPTSEAMTTAPEGPLTAEVESAQEMAMRAVADLPDIEFEGAVSGFSTRLTVYITRETAERRAEIVTASAPYLTADQIEIVSGLLPLD